MGGASGHKNNVKTVSPGKLKTRDVAIFEESIFGEKIVIDEKYIGKDF